VFVALANLSFYVLLTRNNKYSICDVNEKQNYSQNHINFRGFIFFSDK